ncbi:MAG: hypothetical protein DSZ02_02030 [Gammaproteobacteria bacterium]|nr:MAG: hypothetical protein DSZ02_02030 [Gammaproteobacteria bacterium]
MYLIDSCVWIDWLKRRRTPSTEKLEIWLDKGWARLLPVIVQELLHGARGEREQTILRQRFSELPCLPVTLKTHLKAGELYARCRWRGLTIRSPHDGLIAAASVEHGVPRLTQDRDFFAIAEVEPRLVLVNP